MTKVEIFCLAAAGIFTFSVLLCYFSGASRTERGVVTEKAAELPLPSRVNINTADGEELQRLPGIGPALAARIVEYREKNGAYLILEDLLAVEGIGLATLQGLEDMVTWEVER